jgi:hypothetical protein
LSPPPIGADSTSLFFTLLGFLRKKGPSCFADADLPYTDSQTCQRVRLPGTGGPKVCEMEVLG